MMINVRKLITFCWVLIISDIVMPSGIMDCSISWMYTEMFVSSNILRICSIYCVLVTPKKVKTKQKRELKEKLNNMSN